MADKYKDLRDALTTGPEPGQWEKTSPSSTNIYSHAGYLVAVVPRWNDSKYIAAAAPETIRALLAERDSLAAEIARLRAVAVMATDQLSNYERMGEVCPFEGQPMIYAETLVEIGGAARDALAQHQGGRNNV